MRWLKARRWFLIAGVVLGSALSAAGYYAYFVFGFPPQDKGALVRSVNSDDGRWVARVYLIYEDKQWDRETMIVSVLEADTGKHRMLYYGEVGNVSWLPHNTVVIKAFKTEKEHRIRAVGDDTYNEWQDSPFNRAIASVMLAGLFVLGVGVCLLVASAVVRPPSPTTSTATGSPTSRP